MGKMERCERVGPTVRVAASVGVSRSNETER